eukprot:TRINITY_DN525_c0_g1_i1.p1 TRINITY_DN525_c0_g1~~TRINITY_DN525_c0_g1_i1.p1  ORF type:complete len:2514 (+),score=364.24 TRINITY_DN525_c0_g1_i1:48-7589(+)
MAARPHPRRHTSPPPSPSRSQHRPPARTSRATMGRQPPALGADDNPPSPLPPPTPYNEPPTPLAMPESPLAPPPRSLSPRLRPLRRLATRTRRRADGGTSTNSTTPSPPPSASVNSAPRASQQSKNAPTALDDTSPKLLRNSQSRSLAVRPPQPNSQSVTPPDPSATADNAQLAVSNPSETLQDATQHESKLSSKPIISDTANLYPMDIDTDIHQQAQTDEQPSHLQTEPHQQPGQSAEDPQSRQVERHTGPSREQDETPRARRRLGLADAALHLTADKSNCVPSEPAPSEPVPSEPVPSEPAPSEPAPSEPAPAAAPTAQLQQSPAHTSVLRDEVMCDIEKQTNPEVGAKNKTSVPYPPYVTTHPSTIDAEMRTQHEIDTTTLQDPHPKQPTPSPNDMIEQTPMSVEVIDVADGSTQPTQASSKPPRPRQLAVRSDFNKSERQLAVRTQESEDLPPESYEPALDSSPDISRPLRNVSSSKLRKRISSLDDFEVPLSRYGTRSAMKERDPVPTRSHSRRQSEPVAALTSERTRRRRKPEVKPVKGDKLRVLWHIDLLYYEGVVDSVLNYRGKQFYDVTYDSGEREYYLDLTTRKWRFADGRDGNDTDDSLPEPQKVPDYSEFPKIGDKVVVMWHVDGKYYPGVVQDILKTSNGWFYDVGYEGGDREFFLDLHVRKWKYGWSDHMKKKPKSTGSARRAPGEKIKRAARKSTGGGSSAYVPPSSSYMDTGGFLGVVEATEHQPSRTLRKVESLLEEKERQEQGRRAREEQKKKLAEERRLKSKKMHTSAQELKNQTRRANVPNDVGGVKESNMGPTSNVRDVADKVAPMPYMPKRSLNQPPAEAELQDEPTIVIDLPDLEGETFENVMKDISAPLALPSTKKRPRSPSLAFDGEEQIKRKKNFSSGVHQGIETPPRNNQVDENVRTVVTPTNSFLQDGDALVSVSSPTQRQTSSHHAQRFASKRQPHLPHNAAPPARKTVQQRARSSPRLRLNSQHVLQSEPDFIPRPRSASRARSRSRLPSRRRTASPNSFMERRKFRSRDVTPPADYSWIRHSSYLPQRRKASAGSTKTSVADIVSVSGLVAKRWIEENTKQLSVNLKSMETELSKMKLNYAKQTKTEKVRQNRTTSEHSKRTSAPEIPDDEEDAVLGNVRSEFMALIKKYRTVVEQREQVLMQQFSKFRRTLASQNSKLVLTGKQLEKLDIHDLEALKNLQPVTRKKLDIPPPVPPRAKSSLDRASSLNSQFPLLHQDAVQGQKPEETQLERQGDRAEKSEAVAKSLRRKLADLVTRSDWLGEEVKRLQNRERSLVREKREALAELNRVRLEKNSAPTAMIISSSRGAPTRLASSRAAQRPSLKLAPSKPIGIVKNRPSMETRSSGRNVGKATWKSVPLGNLNYQLPARNDPIQSSNEMKLSTARSSSVVPSGRSRPNLTTKPPLTPKPGTASRAFLAPKPTQVHVVTKPGAAALASTEIDRGASFTDDVGKSMDKQAWELIALIFTIWLLQDEGRSEPPKEPGDRMDLWVRDCVGNCLKHARTYLDATSGITTARRSLMHDVDDENVYIEWILGESDGQFERARSNYALWEPTLLDIEWLAEKRVLIGLSICYKKAWGETSARQFETSLTYAKAIAHKAVSNFELYMPHTIVLGPTLSTIPSVAKTNSQFDPPKPVLCNQQDESMTVSKGVDLRVVPPASQANPLQGVVQSTNATEGPSSLPKPSLTISAKDEANHVRTIISSQLVPAKSKTSGGVDTVAETPVAPPLSQPPQNLTKRAAETTATLQIITPTPRPTEIHINDISQRQVNKATPSPGIASTAPPASRTETATGLGSTKEQESDTVATQEGRDFKPPAGIKENDDEELIALKHNSQQTTGGTEGKNFSGEDVIPTGSSEVTGLKSSETSSGLASSIGLTPMSGEAELTGDATRASVEEKESASKENVTGSINVHEAQTSPNDNSRNGTDPNIATSSRKINEVQHDRVEGALNSDAGGKAQVPQGSNIPLSKQTATGCIASASAVDEIHSGPNERATPVSSQGTNAPQLSNTTVVLSMGANAPTSLLPAPQSTNTDASSDRRTDVKGSIQHDSRSTRESPSADLGHRIMSKPGEGQPTKGHPPQSANDAPNPHAEDQLSSAAPETAIAPKVKSLSLEVQRTQMNMLESGKVLSSSRSKGSQKLLESQQQSSSQALKTTSPQKATSSQTKRGPRSGVSKGSGGKGRKQVKSTRKSTSSKSRASRIAAGRSNDSTKSHGSPKTQRKGIRAESESSIPKTVGMVGFMRLPGASPTVPQTESAGFQSSSLPAEAILARPPVGMKRLPQMPPGAQRRILSGVDAAEFDSLPSPIPRRQGLKGVSDDRITPMPYGNEQQGNPYTGNGRWNSQQPVQRKGYKSLSLMPPISQQSAASPFDARAVASPFEYNRTNDQSTANDSRVDTGQETGYHIVEQVDMMNPPTQSALSALDYGVEHVHREPLPSTTEFQERFDRGYDPYRSQSGHIVNTVPREGFGVGRNVHGKDYGKR